MRRLMWFSIGFGAACVLGAYCIAVSVWLPLAISLLLMALFFHRVALRPAAVASLGCALGLACFLCYHIYYIQPALQMDGRRVHATMTAVDYSFDTAYGTAVDCEIQIGSGDYSIRVYLNGKQTLGPGDTLEGAFQLLCTGPGSREGSSYHSSQGILLLGFQRGIVHITQAEEIPLWYLPSVLGERIRKLLQQFFSRDLFPFTQALLLGDGTELSYETDTAFKISGIRHIIAVSGLHVTLLYSLVSALTFQKRYLTAAVALPVLFLFAAVAGFTPSVTRACIMAALMCMAQVFNREYDPPTALGFAVLVMLAMNPLTITSVGFQLSVGCVAGIQLFQKPLEGWILSRFGTLKGKGIKIRLIRWFSTSISMTLSSMSLTTPLSAYYFGTVSLIGIVTNLLTLWVVNFIFNGLVSVCLVGFLSPGTASFLAWIISWPIRFVLAAAKTLASIPLAAVYLSSFYIFAWLVLVYGLLGVFRFSRQKRPGVLLCCGIIGLCVALLFSWMEPTLDRVRVTVLDVGQGQCILVQSQGKNFLIDCGGDNDEQAADSAAQTLLSSGITRLDGIILTHGDRDHAGGVLLLLSRVQADMVLLPANSGQNVIEGIDSVLDGELVPVSETLKITFGDGVVTVFGPTFAAESNENSLCVLFTVDNCDILITGDRGALGENLLLREAKLPQVELLIVGHHGSKNSTTEALLEAVRPEVAVISVGAENPYGHPAQEVLDRLEVYGCRVYRTDEDGTIVFRR